jgi:chemotaxis protein methyltransferase CheR
MGIQPGLREVCDLVSLRLGIAIAVPQRADNLIRLERARDVAGCADFPTLAQRLAEEPLEGPAWTAAIQALTIGETYFFRHQPHFDLLRQEILPALIEARQTEERPWLRLWSAGCASGEEAYSLAIVVFELIADPERWSIFILGTDINPRALEQARAARYGRWSLRGCDPGFIARYFAADGGGVTVNPEIRRMVTFFPLNLIDGGFPSATTRTMDVVLCRNVMIYFDQDTTRAVVSRLREALNPGGWLIVGPTEPAARTFDEFKTVMRAGVTVYRRAGPAERKLVAPSGGDAMPAVSSSVPIPAPADLDAWLNAARQAADQGRPAEARGWCDRVIAADPTNADAYYLLGIAAVEEHLRDLAIRVLRKAVYLDPGFVLAHHALASELLAAGDEVAAARGFANVARELDRMVPEQALRGGADVTAAELRRWVARHHLAGAEGRVA